MKHIPFPRPFFRTYLIAALVNGASIAFILMAFQPFGTDQFIHDYKYLILSGYGIIATVAICLYYAMSKYVINTKREQNWTVTLEMADLFGAVIFGLMACYLYFIIIFGYDFQLSRAFEFLIRAAAVALLPAIGVYIYLHNQFKDTQRSVMQVADQSNSKNRHQLITLKGSNKSDTINTSMDHILYIKAEDNYVILHLDGHKNNMQKHMIRSTMKQISQQLNDDLFFQCHRSYIINTQKIRSYSGNKNDTKVALEGVSKKIPVSRGKVDELRKVYQLQS